MKLQALCLLLLLGLRDASDETNHRKHWKDSMVCITTHNAK
jgi:hypothetical protein